MTDTNFHSFTTQHFVTSWSNRKHALVFLLECKLRSECETIVLFMNLNLKLRQAGKAIRNSSTGIPGNLWSLKFPAGIPGNFEVFPKLSFFLDSDGMVPYYVKPVFSNYLVRIGEQHWTVDPVVDRVERTDRLGCFVDQLDRLHRLVDDFTTRLDLDDFRSTRSTWSTCGHVDHSFLLVLAYCMATDAKKSVSKHLMPSQFQVEGLLA